jgi:hypothetical protein
MVLRIVSDRTLAGIAAASSGAKKALAEIWNAEDHARRAAATFKLPYLRSAVRWWV